ncbi:MAG: hypothetical protein GTO45_23735 [Candidatus Aminicenantes bacterium]|nr:hypothetical protein [Candidatus Aminicenantes bacterium]NIM81770.1 hypothetical protein [Candidatus Aminicenantes bacterium]NIN21142.1 hypothetical protein [Candidatus Aminicenantes bacterium]NIN44964.1 hypothetical protein [Candidatus Aminicenantes bacterium]NIN87778.1 hypothetical protein [Candidatus Aminicenantes bacterium]
MAVDLVVILNRDVIEYCTGNKIDLYGDARFKTERMPVLNNTVRKDPTLIEQQLSEWMTHTGIQVELVRK